MTRLRSFLRRCDRWFADCDGDTVGFPPARPRIEQKPDKQKEAVR